MTYVKINRTLYPATIDGRMADRDWDERESKAITLEMDFDSANALFVDGAEWSIVERNEVPTYQTDEQGELVLDENGEPVQIGTEVQETEWDNSEFSIRGDLTIHVDGTITVKMGKPTDLEDAYEMIYGGAE